MVLRKFHSFAGHETVRQACCRRHASILFCFRFCYCLFYSFICSFIHLFVFLFINFCLTLENVCIETVESGKMTKDLAVLIHGKKTDSSHYLTTQQFLSELKKNLESKIG